ncbi:hypothetical protein VCHA39O220_110084 [Vibrio chagasii]|nr:hypothetical protein VCHA39O220_110084 [Vibrio chagasii]
MTYDSTKCSIGIPHDCNKRAVSLNKCDRLNLKKRESVQRFEILRGV